MNTLLRTITCVCLLIAACCLTAADAWAQTKISTPAGLYKNSGNYLEGTSTDNGSTVFCAGTTGFTLTSSTTDPENNLPYTSYTWEEMDVDGTSFLPLSAGSAPNKTNITNPAPGWHIYRVRAVTGQAGCEPDPTYFTVYVLPVLKVDPRANKTEAEGISFCSETGAPPPPNAYSFTGTVTFDGTPRAIQNTSLPVLTAADFELVKTWYKVSSTGTRTAVGTNSDTYTIDDAANPGNAETYTIALDVKYAITPLKGACDPVSAVAKYDGASTADATVKVYKKAGKPTITVD